MTRMLRRFSSLFLLLASACSEPAKNAAAVTGQKPANVQREALLGKVKKSNTLPFVADTALFFHLEDTDSLPSADVRVLAANWFKHDLVSNVPYALAEFYKIDSLKVSGGYKAYVDSLDIGQTRDSKAYVVGRLVPDPVTSILVWAVTDHSYEACPYFSSQTVYITLISNDTVRESFLLGGYEVAGDPPMSMQRTVTGRINPDLTLELRVVAEHDEDMDQPEVAVEREEYKLAIKDGRFSLTSETRHPAEKVKRKPAG